MKVLSLSLLITLLTAQTARAGIFVGIAAPVYSLGGAVAYGRTTGQLIFIGAETAAVGLIVGGSFMIAASGVFPVVGGVLLVALDESQKALGDYELLVAKKFPFIDDMSVVSELAGLIQDKVHAQELIENKMTKVVILESEILDILDRSDLSSHKIQNIVSELN